MRPKNKQDHYRWMTNCFRRDEYTSNRDLETAGNLACFYVTRDLALWEDSTEEQRETMLDRFYRTHRRLGINPGNTPISSPDQARDALARIYYEWRKGEKLTIRTEGNVSKKVSLLEKVYIKKKSETFRELQELVNKEKELEDYQTEPMVGIDGQGFLQFDTLPF